MSLRLGYLVPEFPGQTHAFFWREICALRGMGQSVFLLSTRRPSLTCRHEFATAAISETHYLFPPSIADLLAWMMSGARGLGRARTYFNKLKPTALRDHLHYPVLFGCAVDLVRWARRNQIDHVHVQSCADAAHVVALARRMGGPPYSLTLHGDLSVYGSDHRSKMAEASFVRIVGTHLRSQVLDQAGVTSDRIFVSCMGIINEQLKTLGQHRTYRPGVLHLVTVARLHPAKGHVHTLVAVRRARQAGADIHLTIAGDGPHRQALISHIREHDLDNFVTLTGTLSENEVYQLLSTADAFVLSSTGLGEAWPVSVMEAMGAGLPVIASTIGATPEMIVSEQDGFLVPQQDEEALFEKIMFLARDVEARRRIGDAARRTASQRFDVALTARVLRDAVCQNSAQT